MTIYDRMRWNDDGTISLMDKIPNRDNQKRHKKNVFAKRDKAAKDAKKARKTNRR